MKLLYSLICLQEKRSPCNNPELPKINHVMKTIQELSSDAFEGKFTKPPEFEKSRLFLEQIQIELGQIETARNSTEIKWTIDTGFVPYFTEPEFLEIYDFKIPKINLQLAKFSVQNYVRSKKRLRKMKNKLKSFVKLHSENMKTINSQLNEELLIKVSDANLTTIENWNIDDFALRVMNMKINVQNFEEDFKIARKLRQRHQNYLKTVIQMKDIILFQAALHQTSVVFLDSMAIYHDARILFTNPSLLSENIWTEEDSNLIRKIISKELTPATKLVPSISINHLFTRLADFNRTLLAAPRTDRSQELIINSHVCSWPRQPVYKKQAQTGK